MRVLLTTISFDPVRGGGTTERTRRLAKHLLLAGHSVGVAAIEDGPISEELRTLGAETYATGFVRLNVTLPFLSVARLWQMISTADGIHILGYWNMLSVAVAFLCRIAKKPYLFSAAGEFARLNRPRPIAALFHRTVGRPMVQGAAKVVAITEPERDEVIERFHRYPQDVVIIPNGVETVVPSEPADVSWIPTSPFILFVGRLADIKGPDLLVQAFGLIADRHPEISLVMAGPDFGLGKSLKESVRTLGLEDRVIFPGFLDEGNRTAAMRRAEFLVIPSRSEAMSLVAVEAGLQALPIAVTDRCGLDFVSEIGAGVVCEADVESIAEALDQVLQSTERRQMGDRWKRYVLEHFQWPSITSQLVATLQAPP